MSAAVTPRHLLAHTSGIEGDRFLETGEGPAAVSAYLERCHDLPQIHAPGAAVSYCNFGYVVLGRLVEVLTGQTFDDALRQRVAAPCRADRLVTRLHEVVRHRVAVGHVEEADGRARVVDQTYLPRSMSPAGATAVASAADLLRVMRSHLPGAPQVDPPLLGPASVAAMQAVQGSLPPAELQAAYWIIRL